MDVDPYIIGIQMKRKEPTKIFMMISNKKTFGFHSLYKIIKSFKV